MSSAHGQSQYQVRFDWGSAGADAVAGDADVIVLVDVLTPAASAPATSIRIDGMTVVAGSLRNAAAVARWALAQQGDKGDRFVVAVIAVGEERIDGSLRFALEDLLGAGAIVDALADVGIDYCSPEAAAAASAFTGLRNATGHLIGASASGRELTERGLRAELDAAIEVNSSGEVLVLGEFGFSAER